MKVRIKRMTKHWAKGELVRGQQPKMTEDINEATLYNYREAERWLDTYYMNQYYKLEADLEGFLHNPPPRAINITLTPPAQGKKN